LLKQIATFWWHLQGTATLFVIIRAFEEMQKRRKGAGEDVAEDKSDEVVLLGEIRDLLRDRV
jgi:large-conductance mechanosensitive channel